MSIPPEFEARILHYYHVEKWRAGTIARHLGVHHNSIEHVLAQAGLPSIRAVQRASQIDVYLPFAHNQPSTSAPPVYFHIPCLRRIHGAPGSGSRRACSPIHS